MKRNEKFYWNIEEKKLPSQKLRMKDTELHPVFYKSLHLKFIILYLVSYLFTLNIWMSFHWSLMCNKSNNIELNWWKINGLLLKFRFRFFSLFSFLLLFVIIIINFNFIGNKSHTVPYTSLFKFFYVQFCCCCYVVDVFDVWHALNKVFLFDWLRNEIPSKVS